MFKNAFDLGGILWSEFNSQSFFDLAGPNWNSWSEKTGTMKVVISARSYKEAFERHVTHVPDEMGQYWRFIRIYYEKKVFV